MTIKLGKINDVELREVWTKEPEFTTWLSMDDNLASLGDELGLDLTLIKTEADVGDFNVDILAEEAGTGAKVIIENQLEPTNHDHLGKLITYASGHNAKYIVWIFRVMREEHRQAIDWLNKYTTEDVNFFGVKLELWRIADSEPAPKFEVVSRPNEWAKTVKRQSDSGELSEGKLKQLNFWTQLNEFAKQHTKQIKLQNGRPQHWLNLAVGNSESHMSFWMDSRKGILGLQLYIPDNKELYKRICDDKDMIEGKLGKLEFHDTKGKAAFVAQYHNDFNIDNQADYEKYFTWLIDRAVAFDKLFRPLLKTYLSEL